MAKQKTRFFCTECGNDTSGWMGKCPSCGSWNTIVEEKVSSKPDNKISDFNNHLIDNSLEGKKSKETISLNQVDLTDETRYLSGISELDRVLGGGFVRGSLVLVGGDPGIGKSTLLLQVCNLAKTGGEILYISGEESAKQISLRANRLDVSNENIKILTQTSFDDFSEKIIKQRPKIVVVDSIQTMYSPDVASAPGSVSQVRQVGFNLLQLAKSLSITIIIVGHVTKDGTIAGPRVLEHMVDTVLYFEGESQNTYRILRSVKNRFGATDEIGIFEMTGKGLIGISNASGAMLEGRPRNVSGSVVSSCMEGTRPLLIEIQALLSESSYPTPQRMTQGLDRNRVTMLLAVLEKQLSLGLFSMDAFINVIGGIKSTETALDLAIAACVISSVKEKPIKDKVIVFGEIGLTGEIRPVVNMDKRIAEAKAMGFESCILPGSAKNKLEKTSSIQGIDLIYVDNIGEMIDVLF